MNVPAPKPKIPPPWANAGLAPLVALVLIAGAKTAQAQEPAVTASGEQPDGADCTPSGADATGTGDPGATATTATTTTNTTTADSTDGVGVGSPDCQMPPDDAPDQGGASGDDGQGGGDVGGGGEQATPPDGSGSQAPGGGDVHLPSGGGTGGGTGAGYMGGGGGAGPGGPGGTGHHGHGRVSHHHGSGGTRAAGRHPGSIPNPPPGKPSGVPTNSNPALTIGNAPAGVPSFAIGQFEMPPSLLPIYQRCGTQYGIPWEVLAAINRIETGFGTNLNVSSAGAVGWMQFLPSTWKAYGVDANGDGSKDPYNPVDAICAAARYLRAAGGDTDLRQALLAYNHADWYVDQVLLYAGQYGTLPAGVVGSLGQLPDPLPPEQRLDRHFARTVARIARFHDVDWALILAVLRARADGGAISTDLAEVRELARLLERGERHARRLGPLLRYLFPARHQFDLSVIALARYNEAIGLRGLVEGMNAVKGRLGDQVLHSPRLDIYAGGRDDIAAGRVDVRVLAVLLYLAESYDSVTVSSLIEGHSYLTSSGNPSLHAFGRAVDISAVNGIPITGHQNPGGITEQVLRHVLVLPDELQPSELISLFDLGGPSFALADHYDHVHIGF
jgi:Transglycosylase SLT domain